MRVFVGILGLIMLLLICNTLAYALSEDYRFFLKKLKYHEDIVYDEEIQVDDTERVIIVEDDSGTPEVYTGKEGITFLEALSGESKETDEGNEDIGLPQLLGQEEDFIEKFREIYVLSQKQAPASLFGITTEYPDEYYEFYNKHISIYVFSTKSYQEVLDIFEVLAYELPYSLNEVNNFGTSSFYINLDDGFTDDYIRIVLEYKKRAFGLKIKKDNYNRVKEILETF